MSFDKKEAVYLVDDTAFLHLKETVPEMGFAYEVFDKASGSALYTGLITDQQMEESPIRSPLACARVLAMQEVGLPGEIVSEVALRTLEQIKEAKRAYRKAHRDEPQDHSIRFINSRYDELFRIPDGGRIKVDFPDRSFISPCEYIDDYHTRVGGDVYHICQFAEILERGDGKASPEPEMLKDQAAWQINHREYLSIWATEDGWDYTVYDRNLDAIDGGQLDRKNLSIQECRDRILKERGWQYRNFTEVDLDLVKELSAKNSVLKELRSGKTESAPVAGKTESKTKAASAAEKTESKTESASVAGKKDRKEACR